MEPFDNEEYRPEGENTDPWEQPVDTPEEEQVGSYLRKAQAILSQQLDEDDDETDWQAPEYTTYSYVPPVPVKKETSRAGKVWLAVLAGMLAVALIITSCAITAAAVNSRWEKQTSLMTQSFNDKINALQEQIRTTPGLSGISVSGSPLASAEGSLTPGQVYAQNVGSVVAISNRGTTTNFYGQVSETASSGSGFIISSDGYVISNYHVIEGATTLTVITYNGSEYPASVIGYDASNDVSLLKIDAEGLTPVVIGSSSNLIVGDQVAAIGNPLGELTSTLTVGYVSGVDRTISTDGTVINMLQTDAAINPGNSGGPLFNMKGEVVGITTAKYSGMTSSGASIEGIGFAIPIDDVIGMVEDLKNYGYVTGAYLGVMVRNMNEETAALYSLPVGSYVDSVNQGSCAEAAGIQAKDIIVNMGGYDVTCNTDLTRALRKFKAGDTTTITVFRSGREIILQITLDEKPHDEPVEETTPVNEMPQNGSYEEWYNYFAPFFRGNQG